MSYMDTTFVIEVVISATTCYFQQCGILTSVDTDKPVQPPLSLKSPNDVKTHKICRRLAKALIRLRVCAG